MQSLTPPSARDDDAEPTHLAPAVGRRVRGREARPRGATAEERPEPLHLRPVVVHEPCNGPVVEPGWVERTVLQPAEEAQGASCRPPVSSRAAIGEEGEGELQRGQGRVATGVQVRQVRPAGHVLSQEPPVLGDGRLGVRDELLDEEDVELLAGEVLEGALQMVGVHPVPPDPGPGTLHHTTAGLGAVDLLEVRVTPDLPVPSGMTEGGASAIVRVAQQHDEAYVRVVCAGTNHSC